MTKYLTLIFLCLISLYAQAHYPSHAVFATTGEKLDSKPLLAAGTPAVSLNGTPMVGDAVNKISVLLITCVVDSNVTCNGANNGYASVNATGGTPPYSYNWSNGDTTSSINNLIAAVYSVIVLDSLGSTDTCEVTLTEPSGLSVILNGTNTTCGNSNGTIDAIVSGGAPAYVYNWNNGQTTEDLMSILPGTYTITITDINGCSISDSTAIVDSGTAFANADILDTLIACGGEEIGLRGSIGGTASFGTWLGGLGQYPDGIHNLTGSYFPDPSEYGTSFPILLITDDPPGICVADTDTVIITILLSPFLEPIAPVIACGGSFDLLSLSLVDSNNTLGQLYFYDSFPITTALASTIITSSGIYYILKVTNTTPSCFDIVSVDITIDPLLPQETWTGAIDNNWHNAGNWTCKVPVATQDVLIPNGTIDCIVYSGQSGICKTIIVANGARLIIQPNGKLEIVQ